MDPLKTLWPGERKRSACPPSLPFICQPQIKNCLKFTTFVIIWCQCRHSINWFNCLSLRLGRAGSQQELYCFGLDSSCSSLLTVTKFDIVAFWCAGAAIQLIWITMSQTFVPVDCRGAALVLLSRGRKLQETLGGLAQRNYNQGIGLSCSLPTFSVLKCPRDLRHNETSTAGDRFFPNQSSKT